MNAEKTKFADYDDTIQQLAEAKTTITTLEKTKGDTAALQAEVDKYKAADQKRQDDEKAAQPRKEVETRFTALIAAQNKMDEDEVPLENRYLKITPTLYNYIYAVDTTKNKEVIKPVPKYAC